MTAAFKQLSFMLCALVVLCLTGGLLSALYMSRFLIGFRFPCRFLSWKTPVSHFYRFDAANLVLGLGFLVFMSTSFGGRLVEKLRFEDINFQLGGESRFLRWYVFALVRFCGCVFLRWYVFVLLRFGALTCWRWYVFALVLLCAGVFLCWYIAFLRWYVFALGCFCVGMFLRCCV